ncbi:MAG: hypothetical protein KME12_22870 [Trichocoleus desertorum ATA4-8-CV12]|nr:hypothetical protein [Trichocoleus desertorum ATA4-8-CV12]
MNDLIAPTIGNLSIDRGEGEGWLCLIEGQGTKVNYPFHLAVIAKH